MDAFLALADPRRRRMVELLAQGSCSAGEIASRFSISAPAVSQHLKTLRETRLVRVDVRGQQRIYTLAPEGFRQIDEWLARTVRFWSGRLDRLGEAMAQSDSPAPGAPGSASARARRAPAAMPRQRSHPRSSSRSRPHTRKRRKS